MFSNFKIFFSELGSYEAIHLIEFHDFFMFLGLMLTLILINFTVNLLIFFNSKFKWGRILHNPKLEFIIMPIIILVNMAICILLYSMDLILNLKSNIKVIKDQWYWRYKTSDFYYALKIFSFDSFMIPTLALVEVDNYLILLVKSEFRLLITVKDILHAWALPFFVIKLNVVLSYINIKRFVSLHNVILIFRGIVLNIINYRYV